MTAAPSLEARISELEKERDDAVKAFRIANETVFERTAERDALQREVAAAREQDGQLVTAQYQLAAARQEVSALRPALERFVDVYCDMVNSGDCGFWDPEKDEIVILARAALLSGQEKGGDR